MKYFEQSLQLTFVIRLLVCIQFFLLQFHSNIPVLSSSLPLTQTDFRVSKTRYQIQKSDLVQNTYFFFNQFTKNPKTPPEAARVLAYISSSFNDGYSLSKDSRRASKVMCKVALSLLPLQADEIRDFFTDRYKIQEMELTDLERSIVELYRFRSMNDGYTNAKLTGETPQNTGTWIGVPNKTPLSPTASQWKRWGIDPSRDYQVPLFPAVDSVEYNTEVNEVIQATKNRTEDQTLKVTFWAGGGILGETPTQTWLKIMYRDIDFESEQDLVYTQKILTQALADSFMETWKVKYTHWTARPSMVISEFKSLIPEPYFPAYVSGHATVSATAAEVLSSLYPAKSKHFHNLAKEAADSRLWGGIHFPKDNVEGAKLGTKVGRDFITNKHVKAISKN